MRPRWVRSTPTAVTDRIATVAPAGGATGPSVPRPRTLRLPTVPRRGLRSLRHVQAAEALQIGVESGLYSAIRALRPLLDVTRPQDAPPGAEKAIVYAVDGALTSLAEAHRRYEIHRDAACTQCAPVELCPWHYARLRSWWDARDRAAVLLVSRIDDALVGRDVQ